MADEFTGKTALITGGVSGIGEGIARALLQAGATVIVTGRPGQSTILDGALVRTVDVTRQYDVDELIASIHSLDILVNCAGIISRDQEYDPEVFQRVVDVNL